MKTILVSGSDTAVGKTWVVGSLAARFSCDDRRIQLVKPVESGAIAPDAEVAAARGVRERIEHFTLRSFPEPIAPVTAAERAGSKIDFAELVKETTGLPRCDVRIVEGAGSIATPIDAEGRDWTDFGKCIEASYTVLVIDYKLGAIGQSRLSYEYASSRGLECGIWLNQTAQQDALVLDSTLAGLEDSSMPLWCVQGFGETDARWLDFPEIIEDGR